MKRKMIILGLMICLSVAGYAQYSHSDSLFLLPDIPKASDDIGVVCQAMVASHPCRVFKKNIERNDSIINLSVYYYSGMAMLICHSRDTIPLGSLPSGQYVLKFNRYDPIIPGETSNWRLIDTITFDFTVMQNTQSFGIDSIKFLPDKPQTSDELKIICYAKLYGDSCGLTRTNLTKKESAINLSAYYWREGYESQCQTIDTVSLGQLPEGDYHLNYALFDSASYLDTNYLRDIKDRNFTIKKDPLAGVVLTNEQNNYLSQNQPNPFTKQTRIDYFLPNTTGKAMLYIYDMQGSQVKNYQLSSPGEGSIIIQGGSLQPGMYMYTLIADDREVETKKMILTK